DAQGSQGVAPCTADPPAAPAEGEERITRAAAGSNARRQVTEYNAPSVINAVLPRDGFWDGRARFRFVDPQSGAVVYSANGALASQAVGPPVNPVEMSCAGRTWEQLANKLLGRKPLGKQQVSGADVVLGGLSDGTSNGLHVSYDALIRSAFGEPQRLPNGSGDDHAKLRANFARIWGQAIQAYETSLVSGQTPFDRFLAGDRRALTPQEDRGYRTFTGKGQCASCHGDNLLGDATVEFFAANGAVNQDGGSQGFHNNGVRPTSDDAGRFEAENLTESERRPQDRGAFKTPVLRNVELTAPYFHTGGFADLRSVVQFYDRRGDFRNREQAGAIRNIRLNANDINDLVAFLGRPLTDPRVASQQAPFDHPSLNPPDGPQLAATGGAAPPTEAPPEDTPRRDPPPGDPPRREPPPRTPPPPPPGPPPPGGGPGGEGSRDRPGRP
ncbi:MAG: hypothetical protein NTZ05_07395, partial [Chloroflexi bacterium]|nr:hypothetical protein [Chloroflexota bacterium]